MAVRLLFFGMTAEKAGCKSKTVQAGKSLKMIIKKGTLLFNGLEDNI